MAVETIRLLQADAVLTEVHDAHIVARILRGSPVITSRIDDIHAVSTDTPSAKGQKDGSLLLHQRPFGSGIGVLYRISSHVGQQYETFLTADGRYAAQLSGVVTLVEQVVPLVSRQRPPVARRRLTDGVLAPIDEVAAEERVGIHGTDTPVVVG